MGLSVLRTGDPQRRGRLLLLSALAILLLTLLGASEALHRPIRRNPRLGHAVGRTARCFTRRT